MQMCHRSALCANPQLLLCKAVSCFLGWETFTPVFATGMWHGRKLSSGAPHWLPTTIWNMGIRTGPPRAKPQMAQTKNKAGVISSFGICSADLSDLLIRGSGLSVPAVRRRSRWWCLPPGPPRTRWPSRPAGAWRTRWRELVAGLKEKRRGGQLLQLFEYWILAVCDQTALGSKSSLILTLHTVKACLLRDVDMFVNGIRFRSYVIKEGFRPLCSFLATTYFHKWLVCQLIFSNILYRYINYFC